MVLRYNCKFCRSFGAKNVDFAPTSHHSIRHHVLLNLRVLLTHNDLIFIYSYGLPSILFCLFECIWCLYDRPLRLGRIRWTPFRDPWNKMASSVVSRVNSKLRLAMSIFFTIWEKIRCFDSRICTLLLFMYSFSGVFPHREGG